jgi:hypothetical protein
MRNLGSGTITLDYTGGGRSATLAFDGLLSTSAKTIYIAAPNGGANGVIQELFPNGKLTLTSPITPTQTGGNFRSAFTIWGSGVPGFPGTIALTAPTGCTASVSVSNQGILSFPDFSIFPSISGFSLGLDPGLPGSGRGDLLLTGTNAAYTYAGAAVQNGPQGNIVAYLAGNYATNGGGGIGVQNASTTLTLTGAIAGTSGSFIKTGPGTLVLANPTTNPYGNNWDSGTYVEGGMLVATTSAQLPQHSDVTVFSGATLKLWGSDVNPLKSLSLVGGTLLLDNSSGYAAMDSLRLTGGTVSGVLTNEATTILLTGPAGIVCSPSSVTSTIALSNFPGRGIQNASGQPTTIQVSGGSTPSGVDLDLMTPLSYNGFWDGTVVTNPTFIKTGAGVVRLNNVYSNADLVVQQGKLRIDSVAAMTTGAFSLTGGTLQYGGPTDTLTKTMTLDAGVSGIEVMQPLTTLTISTPLTGGGGLAIRGLGTLVLPSGSSYTGGTTIDGITYSAGGDDTIFGAPYGPMSIINGGILQYVASGSTSRSISMDASGTLQVAAGQTFTITAGRVNGGYLGGPGTFVVTASTVLTGVTTSPSTAVSVTGSAGFTNFTNGGQLSVAAGLAVPIGFTVFTNHGSGSITVGAASSLNVSDFQTYGTLTVSPAAVTEDFSQTTLVTNTGFGPLYFNGGSRTFLGTPQTAVFPQGWPDQSLRGFPTFVAGLDLHGQNAVVAGGLFVNNGYVEDSTNNFQGTATVVADFGSLVKGAGYFQNSVQTINGGRFQAGNSPGKATFGTFVLGPGGVSSYVFAIDDATGTAGPTADVNGHVSGWGLVRVGMPPVIDRPLSTQGDFVWTATPADKLTVALETLVNPTTVGVDVPGMMDHFDPTRSYSWPAVEWTGSYAGPVDVTMLDAATTIDTSGFANPIGGTFGWALDTSGHMLALTYTPSAVPEPGTLALLAAGAGCGWFARRRRRRGIASGSRGRADDRGNQHAVFP